MPTYEYECRGCGNRFTERMSVEEQDRRKLQCPTCDSQRVEAVIAAAFVATTKKS
jgi:putative FmdB family regulatory protein